jgi:hypothetical protein
MEGGGEDDVRALRWRALAAAGDPIAVFITRVRRHRAHARLLKAVDQDPDRRASRVGLEVKSFAPERQVVSADKPGILAAVESFNDLGVNSRRRTAVDG